MDKKEGISQLNASLTFRGPGSSIRHTSPPCMFFMLNPSLPFFPFLFFFFLQQHFLIMQKQQVRTSNAATTAIAIKAHGGTGSKSKGAKLELDCKLLYFYAYVV